MLEQLKQAVKRRARWCVGEDWYPRRDLRVKTRRFGSPTAGWTVAGERLSSRSVVWCVGIGEDFSSDVALHEVYGMPIEAFDPTPRSLGYRLFHVSPNGEEYSFLFEDGAMSDECSR